LGPEARKARVLVLAQDDDSTRAVYHALAGEFPELSVILEDPVPRSRLLRRRMTKLGLGRVVGQVLFMSLVVPVLRFRGRRRLGMIRRQFHLDMSPMDGSVIRVPSVNSGQARRALREFNPQVVVVNGTRIICNETLCAVDAPFINTHAGITPLYRGVHGGYWALREGRPDLVGTTVHLVDQGIDTGGIIEQVTFPVTQRDSFVTYPYLHVAAGIPLLLRSVRRALGGSLQTTSGTPGLPSKLRYHPTLWGYLWGRVAEGVR